MARPWPQIIILWLIGALAAAQLPKIALLAPVLRRTFDLSLPQAGLLVSLLEIGGALFGVAAGLAVGRFGARRFLCAGLSVLGLASLAQAFAPGLGVLFAARAVEGLGYLLVVIAAPTIIAAISPDRERGAALALWSTFFAVGVAAGSAVTGAALSVTGARGVFLLWAGLCAVGLLAAIRQPAAAPARPRLAAPPLAAWLLTLGFGIYAVFTSAMTMLLPTFLIEHAGATLSGGSLATGLVSLAALPGSIVVIRLLRAATTGRRLMVAVTVPALLGTAAAAPLVFSAAISGQASLVTAAAALTVLLSGVASPLVFARLPTLTGAETPDDPRIAAANGLLTQFGAGGALIGPPLGGLIVGWWGWQGLSLAISVLALAMLAALLAAERSAGRGGSA